MVQETDAQSDVVVAKEPTLRSTGVNSCALSVLGSRRLTRASRGLLLRRRNRLLVHEPDRNTMRFARILFGYEDKGH